MSPIKYHQAIRCEKIEGRKFRITEEIEVFGVTIHEGYETNGASVPRVFWGILSPFTEGFRAALVHDFRYTNSIELTRKETDKEFYDNLGKCGVNKMRRSFVWMAVTIFGGSHWVENNDFKGKY
jgi:hypothetical protein